MTEVKISIIIPVLNEAATITTTCHRIQNTPGVEILVVDGGSTDATVELATQCGVKVIQSSQMGRAKQMNLGASFATGDILLFLHADTRLPQGYADLVRSSLAQPQSIAGAFQLAIDSPASSVRLVEMMVNLRSRLFSLPYGDQAIFLKASVFQELGGFSPLPIMEDFEFVQRLKRQGKITIIPAYVLTSSRRWQQLGVLRTTLINQAIIIGYFLGVPPQQLLRWYRRQ